MVYGTSIKVYAARQDLDQWLAVMRGFANLGEPAHRRERAAKRNNLPSIQDGNSDREIKP